MKITFNDAAELTIQSADIQSDGGLLIKTISATEAHYQRIITNRQHGQQN